MVSSDNEIQNWLFSHSLEKIALYKTYLINYLSVMCNQDYWKKIYIWEPFAGSGEYDNGEGSPIEAARVIHDFSPQHPNKRIRLFVNELDREKLESLNRILEDKGFSDFVKTEQGRAENFLKNSLLETVKHGSSHNFIFIDPYGYTQISPELLEQVLRLSNCDYLLFFPTYNMYRARKKNNSPSAKLLLDLGADKKDLENLSSQKAFVGEIKNRLMCKSKADYVFEYKLQDRRPGVTNNSFHLFFITRNLRGVEKFIEAKRTVDLNEASQFQLVREHDTKVAVKNIIQGEAEIDNKKLCELCLISGHLKSEVRAALKKLERNNEIEVIDPKDERRQGGYYLGLDKPKVKLLFRLAPQD
ncbi:MAG: three-Cys-motif partner protein TcmP [Gammaproteobacteria bacterium AqS3]|nr:three-Cys-motif partner protein TcmP [Gammaproteobacteria bacterium AqS3]